MGASQLCRACRKPLPAGRLYRRFCSKGCKRSGREEIPYEVRIPKLKRKLEDLADDCSGICDWHLLRWSKPLQCYECLACLRRYSEDDFDKMQTWNDWRRRYR